MSNSAISVVSRGIALLAALGVMHPSCGIAAESPVRVSSVLLKLVEQVDVPAQRAGLLQTIDVVEGQVVARDDRLAQIDDEEAKLSEQRATIDFSVAIRVAEDQLPILIAEQTAAQSRHKLSELKLQVEMAGRQAVNQLKVDAALKAQGVAENELQRAEKARERYADAVSQSEIDGRRLEAEKAELESQQARFELEIDTLKLSVAEESLRGQQLAVEGADLQVNQAKAAREVAEGQAHLKRQDRDVARLDLARRRITSPLDGVVVEIYRQQGEWVQPGEPVVRVLRLNRLWVEGFIKAEDLSKCVADSPVTVTVSMGPDENLTVNGRVVFVGREVDPINREVLIRAEIPNDDMRLLPGMDGSMEILGAKSAGSEAIRSR